MTHYTFEPVIIFQVELDKNISILKDKEKELEKDIERLSEQQPIDVDVAVTTTAPLYKQYVTLKSITIILSEVYVRVAVVAGCDLWFIWFLKCTHITLDYIRMELPFNVSQFQGFP
jgi:hypothetical protein